MFNVLILAGHYIPATAQVILESNSIYTKNLKGIGIGNGWVDPYIQYAAYAKVNCSRCYVHSSISTSSDMEMLG